MQEKKPVYGDDLHRYQTSENFVLRRISGEAVLIPLGDTKFGNSMITLNETFCFLYELFSQPTSYVQALARMEQRYEDPDHVMADHLKRFMLEGVSYGLLVEAP